MLSNKHVVVAMLVAPVLAILGWFAVDYFVAERPHAAEPGAAYELVTRSNCRYDSGQCDLANADFELTLRASEVTAGGITFEMTSRFPLQQATIGLSDTLSADASRMTTVGTSGTRWVGDVPPPAGADSRLRVAVSAQGATYYGEVPLAFVGGGRQGAP